jgi:hypothetical protein
MKKNRREEDSYETMAMRNNKLYLVIQVAAPRNKSLFAFE